MIREDAIVLAQKQSDRLRVELTKFLQVRRDHRVALQTALSEGKRGHVPRAVGFREIHAQADRFRRCERAAAGYDEKEGSYFHGHVLEGMVGTAQ